MSSAEPQNPSGIFFGVNPIFHVENLALSIEHYVRVLGFKVDWQDKYFASVSRGKCSLFLCQGDQGHTGAWV